MCRCGCVCGCVCVYVPVCGSLCVCKHTCVYIMYLLCVCILHIRKYVQYVYVYALCEDKLSDTHLYVHVFSHPSLLGMSWITSTGSCLLLGMEGLLRSLTVWMMRGGSSSRPVSKWTQRNVGQLISLLTILL